MIEARLIIVNIQVKTIIILSDEPAQDDMRME